MVGRLAVHPFRNHWMGDSALDHRSSKFINRCTAIVSKLPYVKGSHLFEDFTQVSLFVRGELATSQHVSNLRRRHLDRKSGHPWFCKTPHFSRNEVGTNVQVRLVEILEWNYRSATTVGIRVLISRIEFVAHLNIVSEKLRPNANRTTACGCFLMPTDTLPASISSPAA